MRHTLAIALLLVSSVALGQSYGSFVGRVVTTWDPNGRTMTLVEPFAYLDPTGTRWDAPAGSTVDGASIPKFAWSIVGGPFEDKYRESSVIHDVACVEKRRSWEVVHYAFYTGMLASGVSVAKAKIMYAAVYHFGPRWPIKTEVRYNIPKTASEDSICINVPGSQPVCIPAPKTSQSAEVVVKIDIPPAPQTLTQESFAKLVEEIEARESGGQPMTPEQIRAFQSAAVRD